MPNADPGAFGQTLARLRLARGFTQQQVAARISTYYSDAGAYGRIERAERHPDRDAVIAILVRGLLILDVAEVNRILQLSDYEALSAEDVRTLGLAPSEDAAEPPRESVPLVIQVRDAWWSWRSVGILLVSLVSAAVIARLIPGHALFALFSSCLYAALYVVSVYLETAFEPERLPIARTATFTFALVAVSSMTALAMDRVLVDSGNSLALLLSLTIFLVAGIAQFLVARPVLAEAAIVPATFQTQPARAAHLKNTGYFLLIVVLFWLTPFHCVSTLARELRAGHGDWVRQVLGDDLMLGRGVIALNVRWLLGLLLAILLLSLYMGHLLLDRLRPHARLNSFTTLFYLRPFLYFLLSLVCVGWYAYSLSEFA